MNINPPEDIKALRDHYGSLYQESIAAQEKQDIARLEAMADFDAEISLAQKEHARSMDWPEDD